PLLLNLGGGISFISYALGGLFLLPVVWTLAALARRHPESGGLYVYTRTYRSETLGFVAGWSYFFGKTISAGLIVHALVLLLRQLFPLLLLFPVPLLDASIMILLVGLNMLGVRVGGIVQWLFIAAKAVPFFALLCLMVRCGDWSLVTNAPMNLSLFIGMLPVAVYAMVGFEMTCALAHLFHQPKQSVRPILLGGFTVVVVSVMLLQLASGTLVTAEMVRGVPFFGVIATTYLPFFALAPRVLHAAVLVSMLGGAFGMLAGNAWNLHRLVEEGHFPARRLLQSINKQQVPWACLLVEVIIAVLSVNISSELLSLQKMSIFGVVLAFCLTMYAAFGALDSRNKPLVSPVISSAAIVSTAVLALLALYYIYCHGVSLPYLLLFAAGFFAKRFGGGVVMQKK
ncbi:MAG: APC family permease, partial [Candidatus Dependentiae bacterium]